VDDQADGSVGELERTVPFDGARELDPERLEREVGGVADEARARGPQQAVLEAHEVLPVVE
jgi:hypothetical protein